MKNNLFLIAILIAFTFLLNNVYLLKKLQELGLQNNIKVKNAKLEVSLPRKKYWKLLVLVCPI